MTWFLSRFLRTAGDPNIDPFLSGIDPISQLEELLDLKSILGLQLQQKVQLDSIPTGPVLTQLDSTTGPVFLLAMPAGGIAHHPADDLAQ